MRITRRTGVLVIGAVLALLLVGCAGVTPSNAWKPTEALPSNSYIYLAWDAGYAGEATAGSELHTKADSDLIISEYAGQLWTSADDGPNIVGQFMTRAPFGRMVPGYYPNTQYPQVDPAVPAMQVYKTIYAWHCDTPTGWFSVDHIAYDEFGSLSALDLRFEQRCNGNTPALHGQIHWFAGDPTQPPGPVVPPPAGLWAPTPGSIPSTGNYAYLIGEPDNSILDGTSVLVAGPTADVSAAAVEGDPDIYLSAIQGDLYVSGALGGIHPTQTQLSPGYYGRVQMEPGQFGYHRPTLIVHTATGDCENYLDGWFVIDEISYSAPAVLQSVTFRFEERCDGEAASLHGQFHWSA